jgi:cell wall-associated NlpC family hydrolase
MHRKLKMSLFICSVIFLMMLMTSVAFSETVKTGVITGSSVRIRSSANAASLENILTSYDKGKEVVITGETGNFYKIKYREDFAYVYKSLVGNIQTTQIVEAATDDTGVTGTVNVDSLNVREKPNTSDYTKIITKLNTNQEVVIIDQSISGWYGINHNGQKLWVSAEYVTINNNIEENSNDFGLYEDGQNAIVTGTTLNMRSEPDPDRDNIVFVLNKGMRIELLEAREKWYKVNYEDHEGWVYSEYIFVEASYIFAEAKIGKGYNDVNFREQPNTKAEIIDKLDEGIGVVVVGGYDKWCKVIYNGRPGWIYAKYVDIKEASIMTPGYIIADRVNFRSSSNTGSEVIRMLDEDTKIWIIDQSSDWYKIVVDNEIGYVHSLYVQLDGESAARGTVNADDVKMRQGPSTSNGVIASYDRDQSLIIYMRKGDWYKVKTPDNNVGWIFIKYVSMANQSASRSLAVLFLEEEAFVQDVGTVGQKAVALAQKYLGVRYLWGGTTPKGFDCSGLMYYVYKQYGINLPRVAADQARNGTPVSRSSLKAGDLIFFYTDSSRPGYVSHVGMYIGDGKFIHASSSRTENRVTISSLNNSWYSRVYAGARRYGNY